MNNPLMILNGIKLYSGDTVWSGCLKRLITVTDIISYDNDEYLCYYGGKVLASKCKWPWQIDIKTLMEYYCQTELNYNY